MCQWRKCLITFGFFFGWLFVLMSCHSGVTVDEVKQQPNEDNKKLLKKEDKAAAEKQTGSTKKEEFKNDFDTLQKKLIKDGFKEKEIKAVYNHPDTVLASKSISLFFKHTESKIDYNQYLSKTSIQKAKKYLEKHKTDLAAVEKSFGVDKEIITAVIMVETQFGRLVGTHSVLNALSTMAALDDKDIREKVWKGISRIEKVDRKAFDKWADRRAKWGYKEVKALLEYTFREGMDPTTVYGSYAGALGIAQFMPTSVIAYAKDGDNDKKIDPLNHADAFASIANYLKRYGWKPGVKREKAFKALYHYNHSKAYVETLLKISDQLKAKKK